MELVYFIDTGFGRYEEFYHYPVDLISNDEIYARQLCEYFIKDGMQYKLVSNEMEEGSEILVIKKDGRAQSFLNEATYPPDQIHIEFRQYRQVGDMPLLYTLKVETHWHVIRFLLKDVVDIPDVGQKERDSAEIDEDRKVYVIYVK
ncbi:RNA helicase [Bacillus tianshenii]|nr:RNA helicase [Bacillus tianshenii]